MRPVRNEAAVQRMDTMIVRIVLKSIQADSYYYKFFLYNLSLYSLSLLRARLGRSEPMSRGGSVHREPMAAGGGRFVMNR